MNDETNTPQGQGDPDVTMTVTRPAIDVIETKDGLVLLAELPGCGPDDLDLTFDKGTLTLVATPRMRAPEAGHPAHIEFHPTRYERSFQISEEFDPDKTDAQIANGVLTLKLYRSDKLAPRKIAVKTG